MNQVECELDRIRIKGDGKGPFPRAIRLRSRDAEYSKWVPLNETSARDLIKWLEETYKPKEKDVNQVHNNGRSTRPNPR